MEAGVMTFVTALSRGISHAQSDAAPFWSKGRLTFKCKKRKMVSFLSCFKVDRIQSSFFVSKWKVSRREIESFAWERNAMQYLKHVLRMSSAIVAYFKYSDFVVYADFLMCERSWCVKGRSSELLFFGMLCFKRPD